MAGAAVSGSAPRLELDDIQGLAARGYGNLQAAAFLLIGLDDADLLTAVPDNAKTCWPDYVIRP